MEAEMLILKQKIGSWTDPLTPPQSRTECNSWARGDLPFGGEWKTCTGWKTEFRHMEVEAFLAVTGPDNIAEDAKNAAGVCILVGAAAAGVVGAVTDGAGAAAAAQTAFGGCMDLKGVQELDKYAITFETDGGWSDWA